METVYRCGGVAIVGVVLALLTKKYSGAMGTLLTIGVVVTILTMVLGLMKPVLVFVDSLQDTAGLGDGVLGPVIKSLAIGFLTETGKTIAEEAGEKSIGAALSMAGTVGALYVLLPLMQGVLDLLETLL